MKPSQTIKALENAIKELQAIYVPLVRVYKMTEDDMEAKIRPLEYLIEQEKARAEKLATPDMFGGGS